jgi:hypothetical protein
MINKYAIFNIIIPLLFGCNQKEMIFSAKQVKYTKNNNILERKLIHEECNKTTSNELKNLNYLSIETREKLKSKSIDNLKVSRKIRIIALIPTFLNVSAIYEECYKFEGIIKKN